jgi:hypothetical protein
LEGISVLHDAASVDGNEEALGELRLTKDVLSAISESADDLKKRLEGLDKKDKNRLLQGYLHVAAGVAKVHKAVMKEHFPKELKILKMAREKCNTSYDDSLPKKRLTVAVASKREQKKMKRIMQKWLYRARLYKLVAAPAGYGRDKINQVHDAVLVAKGIALELNRKSFIPNEAYYIARDEDLREQAVAMATFQEDKKVVHLDYLLTNPDNLNILSREGEQTSGGGTAIIKQIARDALARKYKAIYVLPLNSSMAWYSNTIGFRDNRDGHYLLDETGMRSLLVGRSQ